MLYLYCIEVVFPISVKKEKISKKKLFQQNMAITQNLKLRHRSGADVARHIL